ncbi:MAG: hypothetical protein WC661_06670, partial [Opitutaceae bacterium]
PGASSGAFDQTTCHVVISFSDSGSRERQRVVSRPLAGARGYTNQAGASSGVSAPSRMNERMAGKSVATAGRIAKEEAEVMSDETVRRGKVKQARGFAPRQAPSGRFAWAALLERA